MLPEDRAAYPGLSGRSLEAQLTKDYHRVEKGLALASPKRPFGDQVHQRLVSLLPDAPVAASYAEHARTALDALGAWNEGGEVSQLIAPYREPREEFFGVERFFLSRASVRDYAPTSVEPSVLRAATTLAAATPSVCNRQSWYVRYYHAAEAARILRYQNGNRGFGESVPVVALVTVDLRDFAGPGERNQAWIEGGLFSMSLVMALHGMGLDSCMLNMSVTNNQAERLRAEFELDDSELIVMMIAIGYGREPHRRARSPRRPVDEIIRSVH